MENVKKKILIVDDEKPIVDILKYNLEKEGYSVMEAYDGEYGYKVAMSSYPDLILLDVMLPKLDGMEVCKKIREKSNVPIIMLTAKEEMIDKVIGLEMGADDYITKPYQTRELLARIKANLRKFDVLNSKIMENSKELKNTDIEYSSYLDFGILSIDFSKYEVKVNGTVVDLTSREYELLKFLIINRGTVFSREKLLKQVWGYSYLGDLRTVDVTIRRIREKIETDSSCPEIILTKRKLGYSFNGSLEQKK